MAVDPSEQADLSSYCTTPHWLNFLTKLPLSYTSLILLQFHHFQDWFCKNGGSKQSDCKHGWSNSTRVQISSNWWRISRVLSQKKGPAETDLSRTHQVAWHLQTWSMGSPEYDWIWILHVSRLMCLFLKTKIGVNIGGEKVVLLLPKGQEVQE